MQITRFTPDDVHPFLALAQDEGWISTRRELAFLLDRSANGCLACREQGLPLGFVTAVRHGRSGWIGNLLVRSGERGRGIGTALFRQALDVLRQEGVDTVWLTASADGRRLYERSGFQSCDRICRWERPGTGGRHLEAAKTVSPDWQAVDYLGWGDTRSNLLEFVAGGAAALGGEEGFLMLQRVGNGIQIGPFGALSGAVAEGLLHQAAAGRDRMLLDTPAANRAAARLLTGQGFTVIGETDLMYAGRPPAYHPELVYGLATMGSMG